MKKLLGAVLAALISVSFIPGTVFAATTTTETGANVTKFGANGTDTKDDTAAIQKALDQNDSVYIPDGTYMINVEKALLLKSNQKLVLSSNAVLKAIPTSAGYYSVLKISKATNVSVSGGKIVGERTSHKGTTGEWGMGITVEAGSNTVSISDVTISNFWGDGIYLGGNEKVSNININNVTSDNNRRQGISVTNATQVTISNSTFKNTNGIAPEAGIDLEPNAGQTVENINIINVQSYNNAGAGIDFMGLNSKVKNVNVQTSSFTNNADYGVRIVNASDITFTGIKANNNGYGVEISRDASNVSFNNSVVDKNQYRGVSIVAVKQVTGIENITFTNTVFSNNSQAKAQSVDGVRIDNYDSTGFIRNISFTGCSFIDNQVVKTQRYGLTVGFSKTISNIVASQGNTFAGNVLGDIVGTVL